jgi:hypothetical protein
MCTEGPVWSKKAMQEFGPVAHQAQPNRMLNTIVIVFKRLLSIERRVDINALDLACKFLFERSKSKQVVPEDQPIVELVVVRYTLLGVIRLRRVFQENPGLQFGPVLLADPG